MTAFWAIFNLAAAAVNTGIAVQSASHWNAGAAVFSFGVFLWLMTSKARTW